MTGLDLENYQKYGCFVFGMFWSFCLFSVSLWSFDVVCGRFSVLREFAVILLFVLICGRLR